MNGKRLITSITAFMLVLTLILAPAPLSPNPVLASISTHILNTISPSKNIAVILLNWVDNTEQPNTVQNINNQIFVNSDSVKNFYQDTSYGKLTLTGDVYGWFTVPDSSSPCTYGSWTSNALDQAISAGLNQASYSNIVYVWPVNFQCGWGGFTSTPTVYINGFSKENLAHELGHTLGLNHANTLVCTSNGVQVQASSTCTNYEYQDPYDTMGNSSYFTFDAPHRSLLGWLPPTNTQVVTTDGTYKITPLEWNIQGIQALKIVVPKQGKTSFTNYCVEVRQSYGWDQFYENQSNGNPFATNGIMIRQANDCLASTYTYLMDATPNSSVPSLDQTLYVGKTFTDPNAKVSIKTVSIDSTGATVQVTFLKR